ncbi:MAG: hypothetical protein RBS24_07110 [Bacilli bacterium]|nr:hypothetical protein [Bacilli bacterium]
MIDWIAKFFTETIPNLFTNAKNNLVDAWNKYTDVDFIKSIIEKITDFAKSISDFVKDLIPDFGSMRDSLFEKAKEYLPDWVVDKMKNDKPVPIAAANEEKQRVENTKAKEAYDASKQMIDEMQKTRKAVEDQKAIASNTSNVAIQQNNNTQRAQRPSDFREAPDEIENFGMIFMNKTTLGGSG